MAEAIKILVLFKEKKEKIVAEVFEGEKYYLPIDNSVKIFEGSLEDFKCDNPNYKMELL